MTRSLTLQSDREFRYEQRCQKKRIEQQSVDRNKRFENRCGLSREISREVSNEISLLIQKKRTAPLRTGRTGSLIGSYNYVYA